MRVLLVYDHLEVGGSQTQGVGLAREFIRQGHDVAVMSRGGVMGGRFSSIGASVFHWPAPRSVQFHRFMSAIHRAGSVLRAWSPEVIHAQAALPGVLFSVACRRRVPVVFTPHRSWASVYPGAVGALYRRFMYRMVRRMAREVIAVSAGLRLEFLTNGIPPQRCHLIPNGIDLGAFDGPAPTHGPPVVGTVARLIPQKGIDLFIQAAARIASLSPDVRFVIAGDGPLRDQCGGLVRGLGLEESISFLGQRLDIPDVLRMMSVFVSTSRWEGMPCALLEAMAARRPVVATRVLGSSELIQDGENGLLVPRDDHVALSEAILRLLRERDLARALGEEGRRLIEARYSVRAMSEQLMKVYKTLRTA